jgi:hypothetical protein
MNDNALSLFKAKILARQRSVISKDDFDLIVMRVILRFSRGLISALYAIGKSQRKSYSRTESRVRIKPTYHLTRRMHRMQPTNVALRWSNVLYNASSVGLVASREPDRGQ